MKNRKSENLSVSVVMATYNGEHYISEQLQSIMAQLSPQDELIIVDDGSTDETEEIIKKYIKENNKVRFYKNEYNIGVKGTFERALAKCQGDVIILSDQDDIWIDGRKNAMVEEVYKKCIAVLANAFVILDGRVTGRFFKSKNNPNTSSLIKNYFQNSFIGCCMAFRRELLFLALPFPSRISMHDWWLGSCAIAIGKVSYLERPSLLYRRHGGNLSAAKRRRWAVVVRDRGFNLLALITLFRRLRSLGLSM